MRKSATALALLVLSCVGCSSAPLTSTPNNDPPSAVINLEAVGNRSFLWHGRTYSLQDLSSALASQDETRPIERINLFGQQTTIADVVDVAVMAKSLGAQPFLEKDGQLQPITSEITE
jgi:hypothetical protein